MTKREGGRKKEKGKIITTTTKGKRGRRKKGGMKVSQANSIAYRKSEGMKKKNGIEGRVEVDSVSERHNIPGPSWTLLLGLLFILGTVRSIGPRHLAAGHTWIMDKKRMQCRTISTLLIHAN